MNKDGLNKLLKRIETISSVDTRRTYKNDNKKSFYLYLRKDYDFFLEEVAKQMKTSKTQLINNAIILYIESFERLFNE